MMKMFILFAVLLMAACQSNKNHFGASLDIGFKEPDYSAYEKVICNEKMWAVLSKGQVSLYHSNINFILNPPLEKIYKHLIDAYINDVKKVKWECISRSGQFLLTRYPFCNDFYGTSIPNKYISRINVVATSVIMKDGSDVFIKDTRSNLELEINKDINPEDIAKINYSLKIKSPKSLKLIDFGNDFTPGREIRDGKYYFKIKRYSHEEGEFNLFLNYPQGEKIIETQPVFKVGEKFTVGGGRSLTHSGAGIDIRVEVDGVDKLYLLVNEETVEAEVPFFLKPTINKVDKSLAEKYEELFKFIKSKDFNNVKKLIEENPELIDKPWPEEGSYLLHLSAGHGNKQILEYILSKSPGINIRDNKKLYTPIYYSLFLENYETFETLIAMGADINAAVPSSWFRNLDVQLDGYSPAHVAAKSNVKFIKLLAKNGVDLNLVSEFYKETLMSIAVIDRNPEVVKFLIDNGVDINRPVDGQTPMDLANRFTDERVQLLLKRSKAKTFKQMQEAKENKTH